MGPPDPIPPCPSFGLRQRALDFLVKPFNFRHGKPALPIWNHLMEFPLFPSWDPVSVTRQTLKASSWYPSESVMRPPIRSLKFRHETLPFPSWDPSVSRHETDPWQFDLTPLRLCAISVMRPFCFRHGTGRWNFVWNRWKFRDETRENPSWNIEIGSLKFRHSDSVRDPPVLI